MVSRCIRISAMLRNCASSWRYNGFGITGLVRSAAVVPASHVQALRAGSAPFQQPVRSGSGAHQPGDEDSRRQRRRSDTASTRTGTVAWPPAHRAGRTGSSAANTVRPLRPGKRPATHPALTEVVVVGAKRQETHQFAADACSSSTVATSFRSGRRVSYVWYSRN